MDFITCSSPSALERRQLFEQSWRFIVDFRHQSELGGWPYREPGSLISLMKAIQYSREVALRIKQSTGSDRRVLTSDILQLHSLAMASVTNVSVSPGILRDPSKNEIKVMGSLVTAAKYIGINSFSYEGLEWNKNKYQKDESSSSPIYLNQRRAKEIDGRVVIEWRPYLKVGEYNHKIVDTYEKAIKYLLNEFYERMDATKSDDHRGKLLEICTIIKYLNNLHPFMDGNCRTFTILLDVFLTQYNFTPTILDNPNCFDGHTPEQLVTIVIKGMRRFLKFEKGDKLIEGCESYPIISLVRWDNPISVIKFLGIRSDKLSTTDDFIKMLKHKYNGRENYMKSELQRFLTNNNINEAKVEAVKKECQEILGIKYIVDCTGQSNSSGTGRVAFLSLQYLLASCDTKFITDESRETQAQIRAQMDKF